MFLISFLGFLILSLGEVVLFLSKYHPNFKSFPRLGPKIALGVGLSLFLIPEIVFYAHPGFHYVVQYAVSGKQVPIVTSGVHFRWFGQVIELKQVLTLKFSHDKDADYSGWSVPYKVRFNDAVEADISASIRVRLPVEPSTLLTLALDYRSQDNLVNASLMPAIKEAIRNSARMISAQDYIVGKGGIFEQAVIDQLQNGIYELEVKTYRDTSRTQFQTADQRTINSDNQIKTEVIKIYGKDGLPIRKKNDFIKYGIEIAQVVVDNVDPEPKFKELLSEQRDASGKSNVAKQQAQQAQYEKERTIAQGEVEKARMRVDKEKEQLNTLVSAETEMKKAQTQVQTNTFDLQAKELEAKGIKVLADADAYKRSAAIRADNGLPLRLEAVVKVNEVWAAALTGATLVPTTLIQNGESKAGSSAMDLMGMFTATLGKQVSDAATPDPKRKYTPDPKRK